jgi:hypothetical protein
MIAWLEGTHTIHNYTILGVDILVNTYQCVKYILYVALNSICSLYLSKTEFGNTR